MSDYTVIRAVSRTLKELLEDHITNSSEPQLTGVPIDLRSPKEMRDDNNSMGISLWPYRITRNGSTLNDPPPRPAPNKQSRHPLPVDLYYLVTPVVRDTEARQALMGRMLQVFNDHSIVRGSDLKDTLQGTTEELRVTMEIVPTEELTRIWSALQDAYQLSVPYHVQLVTIDSDHEPVQTTPVLLKQSTYTQVLSAT